MRLSLLLAPSLALLAAPLLAAPDVLREQRQVMVDGVRETWRLVWRGQLREATCGAQDLDMAVTCPCSGLAYAQQGDLVLERRRPGTPPERLPLAPFFAGADMLTTQGQAVLQRWPTRLADSEAAPAPARIHARPATTAMHLADYDHDGVASEFLLQIDTAPCGKHVMIAIGVTRDNPYLHALTSADHPGKPLALFQWEWEALARAAHPAPILDWQCGDHGDDNRTMMTVSADHGRIRAARDTWTCPDNGQPAMGNWHGKPGFRPRHLTHEAL